MIPLWMISLLSIDSAGEFSFLYEGKQRITISGKFSDGEWVASVYVYAIPYFAWGCNKFHTGITGSFKDVVRYYLTLVLNQLSEYSAEGRKELLSAIKGNLE